MSTGYAPPMAFQGPAIVSLLVMCWGKRNEVVSLDTIPYQVAAGFITQDHTE